MATAKQVSPEIKRDGKAIVLPDAMPYNDAIKWIERARDADEQVVDLQETIDCHPWDGALALLYVLCDRYGFTVQPSFSMSIATGPNETTKVPWGTFKIPGYAGTISCTHGRDEHGRVVFQLMSHTLAKHGAEFRSIAEAVRARVSVASIYKGKALSVRFTDDDGDDIDNPVPSFLDLAGVSPDQLVLPSDVGDLIRWALFTPIERADDCRRMGIPLRRGMLLAGQPGVGKTLTM